LFINIECLQWSNIAKNLNVSDWEVTFTLSQIPVDLQFYDCAYKLLAAIEYEGTQDAKTVGHYIAHIRSFGKMGNSQRSLSK